MQWEYQIDRIDPLERHPILARSLPSAETKLNELGTEGWEFIGWWPSGAGVCILFKRN
jgi:hypothetical protein